MHRIDTSGSVGGYFVDKSLPGTPGTIVGADYMNDLMDNICDLIEGVGITLVKGDHTQLADAIPLVPHTHNGTQQTKIGNTQIDWPAMVTVPMKVTTAHLTVENLFNLYYIRYGSLVVLMSDHVEGTSNSNTLEAVIVTGNFPSEMKSKTNSYGETNIPVICLNDGERVFGRARFQWAYDKVIFTCMPIVVPAHGAAEAQSAVDLTVSYDDLNFITSGIKGFHAINTCYIGL